jgi:hypothetical protein
LPSSLPDVNFTRDRSSGDNPFAQFEEAKQSVTSPESDIWRVNSNFREVSTFDEGMPAVGPSQLASEDDILSFPSTPHEKLSESNITRSFRFPIDSDNFSAVGGSQSPKITPMPEIGLEVYMSFNCCALEENGYSIDETHSEGSILDYPEERLRLPGDRSGIGGSLNRWVGDGIESADEWISANSLVSPYLQEQQSSQETAESIEVPWVDRPYEDHLSLPLDDDVGKVHRPQASISYSQSHDEFEGSLTDIEDAPQEITMLATENLVEPQLHTGLNPRQDHGESAEGNQASGRNILGGVTVQEISLSKVEEEQHTPTTFTLAPSLFDW